MGDATAERVAARIRPGRLVYGALILQVLLSSGTYLIAKRALAELHPVALLALRVTLTALVFCLVLALTPGRALPPRRALGAILLFGVLAGLLNQGLFLWGLARSTAAHGALLYALTPLGVYLYSLARGREQSSPRRTAGILVALTGVVVLLLGRGLRSAIGPMVGDLFILGGVAAWALYTAEGKKLIAAYGPLRATAWTMIAPGLLILPAVPFVLTPSSVAAVSGIAWAGVVYLAVFTSVASYSLWYYALSHMEASKVAIFANLQPVATALGGWWIFGEKLTWEFAVGGVLVLLGVRLSQDGSAAHSIRLSCSK